MIKPPTRSGFTPAEHAGERDAAGAAGDGAAGRVRGAEPPASARLRCARSTRAATRASTRTPARCRARSSSAARASPDGAGGAGRGHRPALRPARARPSSASPLGPLGGSGSARIERDGAGARARHGDDARRGAARARRHVVPGLARRRSTAARRRSCARTSCCAASRRRRAPTVEFTYVPWSWRRRLDREPAGGAGAGGMGARRPPAVVESPRMLNRSPRRRAPRAGQQPRQARARRRRPLARHLPGAGRAGRSLACRGTRPGPDRPRAARVLAERRGRRAGRDLRPDRRRGRRLRGVRRVGRGPRTTPSSCAQVLGWPGVFLEADPGAFSALERRYRGHPARADRPGRGRAGHDRGAAARARACRRSRTCSSIDVDGNDYWIWRALEAFRPRVVVIEYNGDLDPTVPRVMPYDPRLALGPRERLRGVPGGARGARPGQGLPAGAHRARGRERVLRPRRARGPAAGRRRGSAPEREPLAARSRPPAAAARARVAVRDVRERGFPALDSLRAIAALSVFFFHAVGFYARGSTQGNLIAPYVARLDVGVTIFFLLSGFLLYRPFVQARHQSRPRPPLIPYAWRRALRIVPAYWVALTLAAVVLALPGVFTLTGIPTFYGFLQIYSADTAFKGLGQCWTLCVEVSFYAFLPLWAWFVRRIAPGRSLRAELWLLGGLFAAGVLYKAVVLGGLAPTQLSIFQPFLLALPGFVDHFALGMGLAVLVVGWEERGALPAAVTRAPLLWWAGAAVVFLGRVGAVGARRDAGPAVARRVRRPPHRQRGGRAVAARAGRGRGRASGAHARLVAAALARDDLLRDLPVPPAVPAAALRRGPHALGVLAAPVPAVVDRRAVGHDRARHGVLVRRRAPGAAAQAAGGTVAAAGGASGSSVASRRAARTSARRVSAGSSQSQSSPAWTRPGRQSAIARRRPGPARRRARTAPAPTPPNRASRPRGRRGRARRRSRGRASARRGRDSRDRPLAQPARRGSRRSPTPSSGWSAKAAQRDPPVLVAVALHRDEPPAPASGASAPPRRSAWADREHRARDGDARAARARPRAAARAGRVAPSPRARARRAAAASATSSGEHRRALAGRARRRLDAGSASGGRGGERGRCRRRSAPPAAGRRSARARRAPPRPAASAPSAPRENVR